MWSLYTPKTPLQLPLKTPIWPESGSIEEFTQGDDFIQCWWNFQIYSTMFLILFCSSMPSGSKRTHTLSFSRDIYVYSQHNLPVVYIPDIQIIFICSPLALSVSLSGIWKDSIAFRSAEMWFQLFFNAYIRLRLNDFAAAAAAAARCVINA